MGPLPKNVADILARLEGAGYEARCVGGAVRDLLLSAPPGDYDVATDALPEQVMALFPGALPTGLRHGTVTVDRVEITTYRRDGAYSDRRHPDAVTFTSSLRDDLSRRDFTVNAMALDREGRLCDPFGGAEDLRRGVLRAVGDPAARFGEDALRILRGLRFASRLGFSFDGGTAAAMRSCAPLLREIAPERIRGELTGLLLGAHAARTLLDWPAVLGVPLPEILPSVGFDQRSRYHAYDVWEHTARSVGYAPPDAVLRWTMLLHDLGKPETFTLDGQGRGHFYGHGKAGAALAGAVTARLRFGNAQRRTILTLVERHDCELACTEKSVRRALNRYGEETLRLLLEVRRADNRAHAPEFLYREAYIDRWKALMEQLIEQGACFSLKQLAVRGDDLTALGLSGPAVGRALRGLLRMVVEGELPNTREALLAYAEREAARE